VRAAADDSFLDVAPLSHNFEKAHAGGHGDVETRDVTRHGDADEMVAVLAAQAA